jgi:integrase
MAEFSAILQVAEKISGTVGGISANLWWPSILCADWESGLRIEAMLSIEREDMLLNQGGFFARAENQKDKEADWYPLSTRTMEMICAIRNHGHRIWPSDVTVGTLWDRFRKMLETASVYSPRGAGMAFHRIRRSTASYIAAQHGIEAAQKKLGHSSSSVTKTYLDPRIYRPEKNNDLVPAPIMPPSE